MFGWLKPRPRKTCECGPPYYAGPGEFDRCVNCRLPFPVPAWKENFWDRPEIAPPPTGGSAIKPSATSGYMQTIQVLDTKKVYLTDDELAFLVRLAGGPRVQGTSTRDLGVGLSGEGAIVLRDKLVAELKRREIQ